LLDECRQAVDYSGKRIEVPSGWRANPDVPLAACFRRPNGDAPLATGSELAAHDAHPAANRISHPAFERAFHLKLDVHHHAARSTLCLPPVEPDRITGAGLCCIAHRQIFVTASNVQRIDAEVRRIVEESHHEADRLLAGHRDKLDAIARALLKAESLNATEILEAAALTELPDPATRLQPVSVPPTPLDR
jgi:hypothetical protein